MRILQVAPEFPPYSIGGGGQVIMALANGLKNKGHQLTMLSAQYNVHNAFDKPYYKTSGGTRVLWLPLIPAPKVGFQLRTYLPPNFFSILELSKVFFRKDFDVVQVHGLGHFVCDFAGILSRITRKPYVYTVHGFPKEPGRRGGLLKIIYSLYTRILGAPVLRGATRIVAVSASLASEIRMRFPKAKVEVILNGIDPSCSNEPPEPKMQATAAKFNLQSKTVILALGRICSGKGFQYAIQAMPLILEKFPRAHLVIAGSDDGYGFKQELLKEAEENGVKSNVSFVGNISNVEEKNALLWQAKVVIIPSLEESFGLVAPEAMGSGRLIVASRIDALSEILGEDKYSCLVEPKNVNQLAHAVVASMIDSKLATEAQRHRFLRLSRFDMNRMADAYADLYASLN